MDTEGRYKDARPATATPPILLGLLLGLLPGLQLGLRLANGSGYGSGYGYGGQLAFTPAAAGSS